MKIISLLFLISAVIVGAGCSRDREAPKTTAAVEADNTGRNVRDRSDATKTPEDQSENEADRTITQSIRKAINSDDSLSTNAKRDPARAREERARENRHRSESQTSRGCKKCG